MMKEIISDLNCKMNVGIRRAAIRDADAIAGIESETSAAPWSLKSLEYDITDNDRAFIAVIAMTAAADNNAIAADRNAGATDISESLCEEPGDLVIGYADMWMIAGEAQLNNIAVDERFRGNHYGSRLLKYMMDEAAGHGCDTMTLEVRAGNAKAIAMYRSAGFTEDGIRRNYYQDNNEDALLMSRRIR